MSMRPMRSMRNLAVSKVMTVYNMDMAMARVSVTGATVARVHSPEQQSCNAP